MYKYILKPGKVGHKGINSPFPKEMQDEACFAMLISTIIMTITIGVDVYMHTKAFCIAIGLPFSKLGKVKCFHYFGAILLAIMCFL